MDNIDKPVAATLHVKVTGNTIDIIDVASVYGRDISQINKDLKHVLY